jgi:hypothetical protein
MIRLTKIIVYVVAEMLVVATVIASASQARAETVISFNWGKGIQGSGKIVEVQRAVPAFDSVSVQDGIRVVFRQSAELKLTIKADDNIEPLVEARVDGTTLKLKMRPRSSFRTAHPVMVNLDYTQLNMLSLSDGAHGDLDVVKTTTFMVNVNDGAQLRINEASVSAFDVSVKDGSSANIGKVLNAATQRYRVVDGAKLTVDNASGDRVSISVRDGARMTLRSLDTKAIDLSVADGARADIAGTAEQQSYALSDAASVDAQKLQGTTAQVRASDGSVLKLGLVQTLNADVQDGSSVRYTGDPAITKRLRDGATIKRI